MLPQAERQGATTPGKAPRRALKALRLATATMSPLLFPLPILQRLLDAVHRRSPTHVETFLLSYTDDLRKGVWAQGKEQGRAERTGLTPVIAASGVTGLIASKGDGLTPGVEQPSCRLL